MILGLAKIVVLKKENFESLSNFIQAKEIHREGVHRVNEVTSQVVDIEQKITYLSYFLISLSFMFTISTLIIIILMRFVLRQRQEGHRHGKDSEQRNCSG